MVNSIALLIYLIIIWPTLWLFIASRLASKGLLQTTILTFISLLGFSIGIIMLAKLVPETTLLQLNPTGMVTQYGVIYGAGIQFQPTLWFYVILSIPWLIIGIVSVKLIIGLLLMRQKTKSFKLAPRYLQHELDLVASKFGLKGIKLYTGDQGLVAFSGTSSVYISNLIIRLLTLDQLEAAFAHELAHIKRHDLPSRWMMTLIGSLAFLIPTKHSWRNYIFETEKEADRLATTILGSPIPLAEALVKVAKKAMPVKMFANLSMPDYLTARTMALLEPQKPKKNPQIVSMALSLALTLLIVPYFWPKPEIPNIPGLTENQAHELIEGKMFALVNQTHNPKNPIQVKLIPKDAIKMDSFGKLILDTRIIGRL